MPQIPVPFAGELLSALLFILCIGCAQLSVIVPDPAVREPDLLGPKNSIHFGTGFDSARFYQYTGDASARPPNLNNPSSGPNSVLWGEGGFNVFSWLELNLRLGTSGSSQSGLGVSARSQLLGVGEEEGWKAAIFADDSFSRASTSGDQNGVFGPGGYNWSATANSQTLSAGFSVGYRLYNPLGWLVYTGFTYGQQNIWGNISQSLSDNGQSPAANYGLQTVQASSQGIALGLRIPLSERGFLSFAGKHLWRDWPATGSPAVDDSYNISLNIRWDRFVKKEEDPAPHE